jgi:hypothetical protein
MSTRRYPQLGPDHGLHISFAGRPAPLCYRRRPAPAGAAQHLDQRSVVAALILGLAWSTASFWIVSNTGF